MTKILATLGCVMMPFLSIAQSSDSLFFEDNTIALKEAKVVAKHALNNNDVIAFYRANQFSTLDNLLSRLDGMSLIKRGSYAQEVQLNGFSGGQLNITIDGMRMFGACTDKMDPITSYIEPTNLKGLTVKQGTNSNHTGCNIGGSVDLQMQEPKKNNLNHLNSYVGLGYESISQGKNLLFSTSSFKRKWAWILDGVYRKNENYSTGDNKTILNSQFEKANLHTAIIYNPDSVQGIKVDFLYDDARHVGYPSLPMDVGLARATLIAFEYNRHKKSIIKSKLYYNSVYHVMDDSQRDSLFLLKPNAFNKIDSVYMRMEMPGKSQTLGAYFQADIPWKNKNQLTIKADNYTNSSLAEMTMHMRYPGSLPELPMYMQTWPEMIRNVAGLYIQNKTILSTKAMLIVNTRFDLNTDMLHSNIAKKQFSVFDYNVPKKQTTLVKSLNFSFQYRIHQSLLSTFATGLAERMPTIGEKLGYYLFNAYDGYDYIGNPNLKSEKSNFYKLDFAYTKPKIKINLNQSLSFLSDYILGVTNYNIPALNFYAKGTRLYTNIAQARLYSANAQFLYKPKMAITIFVSSKYTYGRLTKNQPMPLISPITNYAATEYKKKNFSLLTECEYALPQNRINQIYGEKKTPSYMVFNVKCAYVFNLKKSVVDFSMGISNLLNAVYYAHLDWGKIPRPGRSIQVYLKYSF